MIAPYDAQYAELLARALPKLTTPVSALDLACGRGAATRALFPLLPTGSRVVALSSQRDSARVLHDSLDAQARRQIFVRKDTAHRLPFANAVFDLAWISFAFEPLEPHKAVIRQALRVLCPRGTLLVAVVLRDTFVELLRMVTSLRQADADSQLTRPLVVDHSHVLDLEEWQELLRRCGVLDLEVERRRFEVTIQVPPSKDELLTTRLLPQWLGDQPDMAREALATLDQKLRAPVTLPIAMACFRGQRSTSEALPREESITGAPPPARPRA